MAEKNRIGQKKLDNGILFVFDIQDRKMDIEVGYGLEGRLTDAQSSYIIHRVIAPRFKTRSYYRGILEGVEWAVRTFQGDLTNEEKRRVADAASGRRHLSPCI